MALIVGLFVAHHQSPIDSSDKGTNAQEIRVARDVVKFFLDGDTAKVSSNLDGALRLVLTPDKQNEELARLKAKVGPFLNESGVRTGNIRGYDVIYVTCNFREASVDAKVVFSSPKEITGLFFVPKGTN